MSNPKFSIVMPVYNQAAHISAVIEQSLQELSKFPASYELILVVNASRDESLEICQSAAQKNPQVRVVHSSQGGWGRAVQSGLKEAKGEFICYTNSARTQANDLLLFLLYSYTNPQTVIKANRKIRESFVRRLGSLLYNLECRSLFDLPCWDINGTPKIFPRQFKELVDLKENGDLIDLEFNYICRKNNYPIIEIPIVSTRRHGGRSTTRIGSAFRMYWGALKFKSKVKNHA